MNATYDSGLFVLRGMEYLAGIAFLLALFFLWKYITDVGRPAPVRVGARSAAGSGWFRLPAGLYYHPGHAWAMPEGGNVLRIGMDDFAQKLLGRAEALELPRPGTTVSRGTTGWSVRVGSHAIPMLCPVDGHVVAVNPRLKARPDLVNDEPYETGWLFKVRVPRVRACVRELLKGRRAETWMEGVTRSLGARLGGQLGLVLQDGGLPVTGFARELSPDRWDRVAAEFLLTE